MRRGGETINTMERGIALLKYQNSLGHPHNHREYIVLLCSTKSNLLVFSQYVGNTMAMSVNQPNGWTIYF